MLPETLATKVLKACLGNSFQERGGKWPFCSGRVTVCITFPVPGTALITLVSDGVRRK